MTREIHSGDVVEFNVDDAVPDWAPDAIPGTVLRGRFLYVMRHTLPTQAQLVGYARVELGVVVDYDDDGADDRGRSIMRPIYARYFVPPEKLTVVR